MNRRPPAIHQSRSTGRLLGSVLLSCAFLWAGQKSQAAEEAGGSGNSTTTPAASDPALIPFRVGFSMNIFTNVNVNEAKASIKVWAQTVARERGIATDPDTALFRSFDEISQGIANASVDLIALTATEYWKLRDTVDFDHLFIPIQRGLPFSEFVILAHRDGPIHTVSDLRGSTMLTFASPQLQFGETWLDTVLMRQAYPVVSEFAARFTRVPRLSGAVLPVFFRKADACLVDRMGFEMMSELNPQISRQLVVIESSPRFVIAVVAMRRTCPPAIKTKLVDALGRLQESAAGQQLVTVFQMDRLQLAPAAALQPSCDILEENQRLLAARCNPVAGEKNKGSAP